METLGFFENLQQLMKLSDVLSPSKAIGHEARVLCEMSEALFDVRLRAIEPSLQFSEAFQAAHRGHS